MKQIHPPIQKLVYKKHYSFLGVAVALAVLSAILMTLYFVEHRVVQVQDQLIEKQSEQLDYFKICTLDDIVCEYEK